MSCVKKEIKAKAETPASSGSDIKRSACKFEDVAVSYDAKVTAYFEPNKIKNLTGVKAKEFIIWITLTNIYVDQSSSVTFKMNLVGLSKSFPVSVFKV
ncbi:hypothetical protein V6N13_022823 [Hibiscus sabdariffa]